jgi:L-histidine N-alpha-methyltransferase
MRTAAAAEAIVLYDRIEIVRSYGNGHGDPAVVRAAVWSDLARELPTIDSKYFYDDRGSRLFEDITRLPEYYQTRTEERLLDSIADEIVATTRPRELVELGSGAGRKIRLLLDSMRRQNLLDGCFLLDVNETFLTDSAERLTSRYPELEVRGVVGDFLHDLHAVGEGHDRLFLFFAGTIGNLYPDQLPGFLHSVRAVLGDDDAFLVGLDLVKDTGRLEAAYNDSAGVTAEFNRNILRVLNTRFGTDFDVDAFEHVAFYDPERAWIEMRLRATRPTAVSMGPSERTLRFDPGDQIRTEISCKYTRGSFESALGGTGLALSRWWTDAEDQFALALLRSE